MWRFFEDFVNAENNYLPPDNLQETPLRTVACRTSPTNIGLYLCCILAAADLGLVSPEGLCERLSRCLDSVEKLEKYQGHLLNWYNTRTLAPLPAPYVSTVDSGNFVCCLTALSEGLRDYANACPALLAQVQRIETILQSTDFRPLYNPRRRLFYVGMDAQTGEKSSSCYDLFMSEARMTSYWAMSCGQVAPEHWQSLSRTLVRSHRYAGAVSWTGTFFEYFMPCLFLPVFPNSFVAENLSFCLHAQKKYAEKHGVPWGFTESGFYAFDPAHNYAYKAHGVPHLALKRKADGDPVVAPYASFLALPVFPREAYANLKRLRSLHLTGRYGFYEAADFTKQRIGGEDYCVVRSYMAHHLGMSMLSVTNFVTENAFVRRFMRSAYTSPAAEVFNERVPTAEKFFRKPSERASRNHVVRPERREIHLPEQVAVFSNGEWSLFCDRFGRNVPVFAGRSILRKQGYGAGVSLACVQDGTIYPLCGHPNVRMQPGNTCVSGAVQTRTLTVRTAMAVHPSMPAALYAVRMDNKTSSAQTATLCAYLEPFLLPLLVRESHPAYEKLFIDCKFNKEEKIFTFTRRSAQGNLCLAAGFWDNADFTFETDREALLERGGADRFAVTKKFESLQNGLSGTDRCLGLRLPVSLEAGESTEHTLILCAAAHETQAADRLRIVRSKPLPDTRKCARNPFGEEPALLSDAENLFAGLFFDAPVTKAIEYARKCNHHGRNALWSLGISGD